MLPRSFLYVPTSRPELFDKAAAGPADALILDLEDAVPLAGKASARAAVAAWLESRPEPSTPQIWARIDPGALAADVDAVVRPGLSGLVLAKCTAVALDGLAELLATYEARYALPPLPVVGLIEDAATLTTLPDVVRHPRLTTLGLGEVDLLGDLRIARSPGTAHVVDQLRTQIVVHCAAAGLAAPVGPTSTDFRDVDLIRRTTRALADLGFRSRTAIHPAQVPVIHEALTPDEEETAAAADVVARFEAAAHGVTVDSAGRLIDAAVIRAAQETLQRAGR